ncbi:MAG: hypothetical protein LH466_04650 [Sphingomonas bacterium]|nr:hypothetical protein [Sphingomonas bacterium]
MAISLFLTAALAASLTIQPGETWLFRVAHGRPVEAQRVAATAAPAPGQIKLAAKRMMGTMLTLTNNSRVAYTYRATLVGSDGKAIVAKSCVLPAGNRLAMESWPQVAVAVRVSDFKPARDASCR